MLQKQQTSLNWSAIDAQRMRTGLFVKCQKISAPFGRGMNVNIQMQLFTRQLTSQTHNIIVFARY